jgi:myosin heavy subunit
MGFVQKLNEYFGHNSEFIAIKNSPINFGINHHAGRVKYTGTNILDKCKEFLTKNLIECLQKSEDYFVADLFLSMPTPNGSFSK